MNNIKRLRESKVPKMTQRELAEKVGISHTYLSNIENGKRPLSITLASRIAKVLRCSRDDIFLP